MKIVGVGMVHNERDIVGVSIAHHLAAGLDEVLVVDNASTDGTADVLQRLAKGGRVQWLRDSSPYRFAETITALAREAYKRGADWVLPFDADEFWTATQGDLPGALARAQAGALVVQVQNFVQARGGRDAPDPESLLTMTHRIAEPVGPPESCRELVESRQIGFVEMMYPPKYVTRAGPEIEIGAGNHEAAGFVGAEAPTDELLCLHAPLRSFVALVGKAEVGRRTDEANWTAGLNWHARRFKKLQEDGALEAEWAANSVLDGALDVFGARHTLVEDTSLRDLVAPWIRARPPSRFRRSHAFARRA